MLKFLLAFMTLAASLAPLPTAAQRPVPENDPSGMVIDRAIRYEDTDEESTARIEAWCAEVGEHDGRPLAVFMMEYFGGTYFSSNWVTTLDEDGNVLMVRRENPVFEVVTYYDPPLLFLPVPLEAGHTWEARTTVYDNPEFAGEGTFEHHRFTVGEPEVWELPGGPRKVYKIRDEPIAGESFGEDWYANGIGRVQIRFGNDGPIFRMAAMTDQGPMDLPGVGEPYALNFGWKAGDVIRVRKIRADSRIRDGEPEDSQFRLEYDLTVDWNPVGLLVRSSNLQIPGLDDSVIGQQALALLANSTPDFLIDRDGPYRSATNLDNWSATLKSFLEGYLSSMGPTERQNLDAIMESLLTSAVLDQQVAELWNTIVGVWLGLEGHTGVMYEGTMEVVSALVPGIPIPMDYWMGADSMCPCTSDGAGNDCIKLNFVSRTDTKAATAVITEMLSRGAPDLPPDAFQLVSILTVIQTVMDPDTMRPYSVSFRKTVSGKTADDDGQTEPITNTTSEYYFFSYDDQ